MEQIQKQTKTKKQRPAWWKILQRVLAAVLAFAMVLSTSLLLLTRVTQPDDETISQSTAEIAYQSISEDNKYLTASTSERVKMLLSRIGRQPKTAEEYEQVASMYAGRGNYAEAAVLYQNGIDVADSDDTDTLANLELKLGSAYVLSGDMERAEKCYLLALDYDKTLSLADLLLAQVYYEQERYEDAAEQLRKYLQIVPYDTDNRTLLGNLYENLQQYEDALSQYIAAYLLTKSASDCINVARAALLSGNFSLGDRYLTIYLEENEDTDGFIHYLLGVSQMGHENYAAAQEYMLEAISIGYEDAADCYVQLTLCTYMQGDYAGTLAYGKQAEALWETPSAECLQRMGLSQMQLGDYASAAGYLRRSAAADSTLIENYYYIATACLLTEDYEGARSAYGTAIENGYLLQECYYNRAICSLQLEDYEAAATDLLACLDTGDDETILTSAREILEQLGVQLPAAGN